MAKSAVNRVAYKITGAAIEVHKNLGPDCWNPSTRLALLKNSRLLG